MNCYTCATRQDTNTTAVAICSVCGAGICREHATVGAAYVEVHSPGSPSAHALPGRRMFCIVCAPEQSGSDPSPVAAGHTTG